MFVGVRPFQALNSRGTELESEEKINLFFPSIAFLFLLKFCSQQEQRKTLPISNILWLLERGLRAATHTAATVGTIHCC